MKHTKNELAQMQSLPLNIKIQMTKRRIREWYEFWDGQVYVSFSGGEDSTVLLHMVRELYPDVEAVFVNTGLEFPEIQKFVKTFDNVTILRPEMRFDEVIKKYGYPIISKEVSKCVYQGRLTLKNNCKKYSYQLQKLMGTAKDKNGNKKARISPELNAIPGWLEDREQMFHDGILYDYFKDNIKELYIKQTSDFAGGRGFHAMSELAGIFDFDGPQQKDRWLFEKHVGEMKNLLPITLYANEKDELFSNEIKTNRNDKNFNKNSAKIVLCTRFNESNHLKPERDISELFSLPDPLLRVFADKPSDAVKLLRSQLLLEKTKKYNIF